MTSTASSPRPAPDSPMADQKNLDGNIFAVETRFQQLARRPSGVSRERALNDAQRQIDEMKSDFGDWLDRELEELTASIRRVAADPGDAAALERANQACCQLRDVGGTM